MNKEEKKAVEKLTNGEKITLTELIRKIKKEGIERFIVTRPEYVYIILNLIEKLQKENEELRNKLSLKQFDIKVVYTDYLEKLNEYKENSISIQKVKDKIEKYKKLSDKFYVKFLESDRYNTDIREKGIKCDAIILALEELIEEREEKAE